MIGRCEKFIKSSSLEAIWVYRFIIFSFGFQFFFFLIISIFGFTFKRANFYITDDFSNKGNQLFYLFFFAIFLISVIKKKGFPSILKSGIKFFFFLFMTNSLIIFSNSFIIPQKYDDIENFILIEDPKEQKKLRITFIEKLLKKILRN